ncbi:MAG: hypothetical protein AB2L11_01710 [Syntrophobacteraceae bacterium]
MTLVSLEGVSRAAQEVTPVADPFKNIALGQPYTLEPKPNYKRCSDAEDIKQLTDGQYTNSFWGRFWTERSTVGWRGVKYTTITIDLGTVRPIKGVSFNTAAGYAGVLWPSEIYVFVSGDGKNFYEAGELVALSKKALAPPEGSGRVQVHRYSTTALCTHGRYLSLLVLGEPYIFVDEIEVYEGDPTWVDVPLAGSPVSNVQASKRVNLAVEARLESDIQGIRDALRSKPILSKVGKVISAQLESAEQDLLKTGNWYHEDFRAEVPLNPLHEKIFNIQAQLWRAMGFPLLSVWQSDLWGPLQPIHSPSLKASPSVRVDMMLNEYRAGAFNISNSSDDSKTLRLKMEGLPGGINPPYVTVHAVAWTLTSGGYCFPAALPEAEKQDSAFLIHTPSGLTRQVWFTFHPTNVEPGVYHGRILLSGGGKEIEVPLVLHVYPFHFPDQPTLHLGGWDYTDRDAFYDITPQNRDKVIAHLRSHFVDSPWATASVLPFGDIDANGSYQADTTAFDSWVQRWLGARQYCVFLNARDQLGGSPMGTPEFSEKVKEWIRFWATHVQDCGLRPDQLFLLIVDEPRTAMQDEKILQWALAIRSAGSGVRIWEDPIHKDPSKANQKMLDLCDVLCPGRWNISSTSQASRRDYFTQRLKQGAELALYSCKGPARELDPYSYYRLQSWLCWDMGALGSYFWSFGDAGNGSSWNEFTTTRTAYVPFFLDTNSVTPGKQMEAIREGIEDYEYFIMLRKCVDRMEGKGLRTDMLHEAQYLLGNAPKDVCKNTTQGDSYPWSWITEKDRIGADLVRIRVLNLLSGIQKAEAELYPKSPL